MTDILQWNCKGLRSRAEILKMLINEHNPGIICLQETKLGNTRYNPGLNYDCYQSEPPLGDRAKGGTAIIVHKSIQHDLITITTNLQAFAVRFIIGKQMTVCSIYLPPDLQTNVDEIQDLVDQLPAPFLLLGDFNAHNPLWGSINIDGRGEIIEELVDNNAISLLNDGSSTYSNIHTDYKSAIDLSVCSSELLVDFEWAVNEFLYGSDHFPIHLKSVVNTPKETTPKWKEEEADWVKYNQEIKIERVFDSFESHLEAYKYFIEKMLDSAELHIPKTKGKPGRPAVPWWNKSCSVLRKITRKCYRKFKNSGSIQSKIIYQRALAKQRNFYKRRKRESWMYYINGITSKTPTPTVWKKIRKLQGKFVPTPLPTLKVNNSLVTDPNDVAEALGKHFADISSPEHYSPEFQRIRNTQSHITLDSDNSEVYNGRFSMRELREALSTSESTAPGQDNIIYGMMKHLPSSAERFLLEIFNKIWETSILPTSWKLAIIIPIRKPGKDASQATSYRPIALTSCVCKLMEKMVNNRLVWFLENKNILSTMQFGFRKH